MHRAQRSPFLRPCSPEAAAAPPAGWARWRPDAPAQRRLRASLGAAARCSRRQAAAWGCLPCQPPPALPLPRPPRPPPARQAARPSHRSPPPPAMRPSARSLAAVPAARAAVAARSASLFVVPSWWSSSALSCGAPPLPAASAPAGDRFLPLPRRRLAGVRRVMKWAQEGRGARRARAHRRPLARQRRPRRGLSARRGRRRGRAGGGGACVYPFNAKPFTAPAHPLPILQCCCYGRSRGAGQCFDARAQLSRYPAPSLCRPRGWRALVRAPPNAARLAAPPARPPTPLRRAAARAQRLPPNHVWRGARGRGRTVRRSRGIWSRFFGGRRRCAAALAALAPLPLSQPHPARGCPGRGRAGVGHACEPNCRCGFPWRQRSRGPVPRSSTLAPHSTPSPPAPPTPVAPRCAAPSSDVRVARCAAAGRARGGGAAPAGRADS